MKIVVIDGQGGRMGSLFLETYLARGGKGDLYAVGTNSAATAAMLKAGAQQAATGERPVLVCCRDADYIVGPIGILAADSLLGEVTPAMAVAIGQSPAQKILLPVSRCQISVAGVGRYDPGELAELAVSQILNREAKTPEA